MARLIISVTSDESKKVSIFVLEPHIVFMYSGCVYRRCESILDGFVQAYNYALNQVENFTLNTMVKPVKSAKLLIEE